MAPGDSLGRLLKRIGGEVTGPDSDERSGAPGAGSEARQGPSSAAPAPRIPPVVGLVRSRLLTAAERVADHRLVLVVAPAGSGKSTLLAQFMARTEARTVAYTADASDRRVDVLLAGLERSFRDPGRPAAEPIDAWTSPEAALLGIADAAGRAPNRIVVVVDDLHCIDGSDGLACLQWLFTRLPHGVTALVGSRQVPDIDLSSLRLADQLVEITADDLRFRSWEIEELFAAHYGTRLPPAELARLARATDGWAAGLKLFHLATSNRTDQERRIELDRLAKSRARTVREYLTQNVLAGLPSETRQFLVRTSVLGHLTPAICDELLERTRSITILDELARQQLFTETNGDNEFRYHEVLRGHLESVLADELEPRALQAWYQRAAVVLEAHGAVGDAIRAYVCADDIKAAARVLGDAGDLLSGPDAWVERLPAGLFAQDAWVQLVHARRLLREGRPEMAWRAFRSVDDRSSGGTAGRLARREGEQLQRWIDPVERPAQDGDWLSLLRRALRADPSAVRLACSRILAPEAGVAAGLAALLDGDAALAARLLGGTWGEPATGLVGDIATAGRAIADWLDLGADPAPILSRVRDQADRARNEWFARMLRAVLLAVPRPDDGPFELLSLTVEKAAADSGDQWCLAIASLFAGMGRALDDGHPLASATAISRLDDADERFTSLGADVLSLWAQTAADALRRDRGSEADPVRVRRRCTMVAMTKVAGAGFLRSMAEAQNEQRVRLAGGGTTLRRWFERDAQPFAPAAVSAPMAASAPAVVATPGAVRAVEIRCFGPLSVRIDGCELAIADLKPRPRSLLRYLAARAGRWVHRDELIESLWPQLSASAATNSLHVALTAIRNVLGPHAALIGRNGEAYRFHGDTDHDLRAFERLIDDAGAARRRGEPIAACGLGERAIASYTDEVLSDEGASEWAVALREQYRRMFVGACAAVAEDHLAADDDRSAAIAARRGLACDRYSDRLWRTLQEALTSGGLLAERARAEGEYRAVLGELGLSPVEGPPADAPRVPSAIMPLADDGLVTSRSR